jgi:hypothetical protein
MLENPVKRTGLIFILFILAFLNIFRLPASEYKIPMNDFKAIYAAGRAFAEKRNPYRDDEIKRTWQEISSEQGLSGEPPPGLPETPFVYPPALLLFVQPITWLDFEPAKIIFFTINIFFLLGILILIAESGAFLKIPFEVLVCGLVLFALKGTRLGLVAGQMVFFSFFCSLLAIRAMNSGRRFAAILSLALALFKYSFALPFLIYFLLKKQYTLIIAALGVTAGLSLATLHFTPGDTLATYIHSLQATLSQGGINDYSYANARFFELTGVQGILYYLTRSQSAVWLLLIFLASAVCYFFWRFRSFYFQQPEHALVFLMFASLLLTYHRIYDSVGLLVVFAAWKPSDVFRKSGWKAFFILPLFLPLTGLVLRLKPVLHEELFYLFAMDVPMALVILFFFWVVYQRRKFPSFKGGNFQHPHKST